MLVGLWLVLFLWPVASPAVSSVHLCKNIYLLGTPVSFSTNERVLICGSEEGLEAWRDIPLVQARYHLRLFLEERGYMSPKFEMRGPMLFVDPGPRTRVRSLRTEGQVPSEFRLSRKRKIKGQYMTPRLFDELQDWVLFELRRHGYACPQVKTRAEVWQNQLIVEMDPGPRRRIRHLGWEGRGSLHPTILKRYLAFQVGDVFDVRETQLTSARLLADGLFQSAYIQTQCRDEDAILTLRTDIGAPRLLRFAIGASTEEFPFADLWYRHSRLDNYASSLLISLHGSPRAQVFSAGSELYILPWTTTSFLGPRFRIAREKERDYEVFHSRLGADLGRQWDLFDMRWQGRLGPTLNYVKTVQGIGPDDVSYVSWEASLQMMDHDYELYLRRQYQGWQGRLEYRGQRRGLGSPLDVDRYDLAVKYLWNPGGFSPPRVVLASRLGVSAVRVSADLARGHRESLPVDYRLYFGGDQNLRGFPRQGLNREGLGYLTALWGGVELRWIEQLPFHLEPFLLWDVARLGAHSWRVDPPIFHSYGAGVRWASPVGTLRASIAKGEIQSPDAIARQYPQGWVLFFSFGQEF